VTLLSGRYRWLTNPSSLAVAIGFSVAAIYALGALELPAGTAGSFACVAVCVGLMAKLAGDLVEQARLSTLRQLGQGSMTATPANLEAAAQESVRAPGTSFLVVLVGFAAASLITGVVWWLIAMPPLATAGRVALIGILMAPLSALIAHLLMLPRSRELLRVLVAAGLPVERLYSVIKPTFALRSRLMTYALIAVVTPMGLVIDITLHHAAALSARPAAPGASELGLGALAVLAAVVLIIAACAWLSGNALGEPMRELARETERLARGEYGKPTLVPSELEVWGVARALAKMETRLVDSMKQLDETTLGITKTTQELVSGSAQQNQGIAEQTGSLSATVATTDELARSARHIADNAKNVSSLARQTLEVAKSGKASAEAFAATMQQVRGANQAIADSVVRLNKRVQQVGKVVEFIDGIADKSDLLALNAELEGNKAGEVGRGFSLVAAEMRRLAESVMSSTREIVRLIAEIRDSTNAAVMATEAGVKATEAGTALAQQVRDGLSQIVDFANDSSDATASISAAIAQQRSGTHQLAKVMAGILRSTEAGVDLSHAMSSTNDALAQLAGELKLSLEKLQVKA